ncbi:hypothetical protein G5B37_00620 [Rasiella rasia]|uniref:Glycerophosphoryl diester phosphodiesterase membrane domain-containing protein n=1 Tax=Rasiella rasia TaxID=2744027 RepID=A0A6G6GK99_9FLAO|nr:hypothetical protein [Rasiella rasia]QIE58121.1 hypothetical protein G5B37_00620 [Rasiella rasia]
MHEPIVFKKQRELGAILGDTFKFIRLQWKPLFSLVFRIAGPALVILVIAYVFYMQTMFGSIGAVEANPLFYTSGQFGASLIIALVLIIISGILYYGLMYGTVMYAIKSYINSGGIIDKKEVISEVKKNFWGLMGVSFLTMIITVFGFVFCVLPGIYFGVVLASTYAIYVFEKRSVTDAISYSFQLIKNEWWITFATLLVTVILYYIIMMIAQIPQYIYFFIKMFTVANTLGGDPSAMFDWGYIALNAFAMIVQYLLYIIIVIATGFIYFNLNEKKNFTGTIETIESIGQRE